MTRLIGLDVGITGTHALAIDEAGGVVASASVDYPVLSPRPGWTEQDPGDWWRASREALGRVVAAIGGEVAAIGLTGQMNGAVFLDQDRRVVRPALLWNDARTALQCDRITDRIGGERLIEITGNPALTNFQAPKILWLHDVEPVQYRHLRHVMPPKDYVRLMLTGELSTDVSDASGTLLFDLRRRDWSAQILAALEIPREWLPRVQESPEVSGQILPSVASELGLPTGVPVAAGAGDHAAAALADQIVDTDSVSSSLDARGILTAYCEALTIDRLGRLVALCHAMPGRYQLMAITPAAGTSLRWWRDILGGRMTDDELVKLAASAPPGADGLRFLPHRPGQRSSHPAVNSRGAFVGLRAHHSRAHLTRAVIEGIVFSLRLGLDTTREVGVQVRNVRATGMGGRSGFWRRAQADIFNRPVTRTVGDGRPAYGAALLAGVAAGAFRDISEAAALTPPSDRVNQPDPDRARMYETIYGTFRQLHPALHDVESSTRGVA